MVARLAIYNIIACSSSLIRVLANTSLKKILYGGKTLEWLLQDYIIYIMLLDYYYRCMFLKKHFSVVYGGGTNQIFLNLKNSLTYTFG